jgi:GNAT superfamily N-acetyltransferase
MGSRRQCRHVAEVTPPRPLSEPDARSRFDCGRASLNNWFERHAWANHVAGISRTNVICDAATAEVIGYVTLSVAQIERAFLPKQHQRNKPDPVPATLLGQLAIHKDHQGKGHARSLLLFALRTALRASRDIGSFGVITYPIDDQVRSFHGRWGFQDLPFDPGRAMIVRMIDLERSGIEQ